MRLRRLIKVEAARDVTWLPPAELADAILARQMCAGLPSITSWKASSARWIDRQ